MKTAVEIKSQDEFLTSEEINDLLATINNAGIKASLPAKKIGELGSFDPAFWTIIVDIANVGALSMAIKGLFDVIIEWQKSRSQMMIIKIGEISLEIPANATQQQVNSLTKQAITLARSMEKFSKQDAKGDQS